MQRTLRIALVAMISFAATRSLQAQEDDGDANSAAAYFAITTTPLGALPPVVTTRSVGLPGIGLRGQFGYIDEEGSSARRMYALGLDIAVGRSTLGLTGGILDFACDEDDLGSGFVDLECKGGFTTGASWTAPIVSTRPGESAELIVSIDGALGFTSADVLETSFGDGALSADIGVSTTSLAAGLGLPLALVAKSGNISVVPHITPRFAFGRTTLEARSDDPDSVIEDDSETESGTRFMLGGGVGLQFAGSGLGLNLGFQKVFIEDGKTLVGVGVTYNLR